MTSGVDPSALVTTNGDKIVKTLLPEKRPPDSVVLRGAGYVDLDLARVARPRPQRRCRRRAQDTTLTMYATDGTPVARYHLENAWPSKVEHGGLASGGTSSVMETVTLVCDRIRRVAV